MMIVCDTGKIRIAPAHVNAAGFAASGRKVGEARSVRVDDTLLIRQARRAILRLRRTGPAVRPRRAAPRHPSHRLAGGWSGHLSGSVSPGIRKLGALSL